MGGNENNYSTRPSKKQKVVPSDQDDKKEEKVDVGDEKKSIKVKILFFASAREAAGDTSSTDLEMNEGMTTTDLRKKLSELYPKLAPMVLDEDNLTLALNEEYVTSEQVIPLNNGDTIALIPPISGG